MHRQQQQPALSIVVMHSHDAWIMSQQALSPEVQVNFIPSLLFSIFIVQRGIMSHWAPVGMVIGMVAMPLPAIAGMLIPVRSINMFDIEVTPLVQKCNPVQGHPREHL